VIAVKRSPYKQKRPGPQGKAGRATLGSKVTFRAPFASLGRACGLLPGAPPRLRAFRREHTVPSYRKMFPESLQANLFPHFFKNATPFQDLTAKSYREVGYLIGPCREVSPDDMSCQAGVNSGIKSICLARLGSTRNMPSLVYMKRRHMSDWISPYHSRRLRAELAGPRGWFARIWVRKFWQKASD